jgi:sulfoxide reductase heme-binding subunit YedZ
MNGAFGEHLFWTISRASGIAALLVASAAVGLGLMMSGRLGAFKARDLRPLHETLSLCTMVAIVVHAAALLGDSYLSPSIADVTIPFVSGYEPLWTSLGIIAGWSLILLGLSFYARAKIGIQRWRMLHRFTALAWILSIGHSLGEGTDAGRWWFLASLLFVAAPALALLARRWLAEPTPA